MDIKDCQEIIPVNIEMTKGAYEWFSRLASNNNMDLGKWMTERVVHVLNRSLYNDLTGYEYQELEDEVNRRIEEDEDEAHPTLVYHDYIEEWHRRRLKEELTREKEQYEMGEPRFGFKDAYCLVRKYLGYIESEEENWEMKMSEPLKTSIIINPEDEH